MRRLQRVGESLRKDATETQFNTRRISANLPLIERKLDIVSTDTNYKLDFPITNKSHAVYLNLQVKPDNCCDCLPGAEAARRYATGYADYIWNEPLTKIPGFGGSYSFPPHQQESGVDYPVVYKDPLDTQGTITNIWFAWEGYPFFYPTVTNTWNYGNFTPAPSPTGGIIIPTNGVYTMVFRNRAGGSTTDTSEIVASIKRLPKDLQDHPEIEENWQTISRKIYSIAKNNICSYTFKTWADMWGMSYDSKDNIEYGGNTYVKVCASYGHGIGFNPTVIGYLGGLFIAVYAYCVPLNEGDIIGGWLKATDVNGWSPSELDSSQENLTQIDLLGLGFGAVVGRVTYDNTGIPLEGVLVVYNDGSTNGETYTNDEGRYMFYELTPGITYTIIISKSGYVTQAKTIAVEFNVLQELDFIILHEI